MSTQIVRQGTSLAETSQEELQKLSAKAGVVPKSPAGAAAIGANPDVAKMAGTPAQKPSRIAGTAEPTLATQQRLTPPSTQAMTAPEKLERMKQLGSLGTQVEGLVQGYLQQIQTNQAALTLNTTALSMVSEAQRVPLEAALTEYKSALTAQQRELAVIKAGNALGRPLTAAEMTGYFAGAPEQLGSLAKAATPESVSLRDLNLSAAGVNIQKLALDLDVSEEELSGLSLPQLNAKIEEIKRAEFAEADEAEAEALSAVGNRAVQLQGERQTIGQSGRMGYEAQFDDMQAGIESAATVKVAGQEMTIDALLSDESLSHIISGAAISSLELNKLRQTEPALADWITQYKASLVQLSGDAGLVAADVVGRQAEAEGLKKDVSEELFASIFGEGADILSAEELEALKANMQSSGLWQALSTDSNLRARLEASPDAVEGLKSLSKPQLQEIMAATKTAEAMPVLGDLMGYTPGGLLTPQQVDFVNTWKDELKALPPSISSDPKFQELIKNSTITEAGASLLAESPELWDQYKAEQASIREVGNIKDEEQFLELLTGNPGFGVEDFNAAMENLRAWAATGDSKAIDFYTKLQTAITGPDDKLDLADVQKAIEAMSAAGQDISGFLDSRGKGGLAGMLKKLSSTLKDGSAYYDDTAGTKMLVLDYLKNDQRIDATEMQHLIKNSGEGEARKLLDEPWLPNRTELAVELDNYVRQDTAQGISDAYAAIKQVKGVWGLNITPDGTIDIGVSSLSSENYIMFKQSMNEAIRMLDEAANRSVNGDSYRKLAESLRVRLSNVGVSNQSTTPAPAPTGTPSAPSSSGATEVKKTTSKERITK